MDFLQPISLGSMPSWAVSLWGLLVPITTISIAYFVILLVISKSEGLSHLIQIPLLISVLGISTWVLTGSTGSVILVCLMTLFMATYVIKDCVPNSH